LPRKCQNKFATIFRRAGRIYHNNLIENGFGLCDFCRMAMGVANPKGIESFSPATVLRLAAP
jgi:hypothetical protein